MGFGIQFGIEFKESMFMRCGPGRPGIVGISLKPDTLKTWALSRHICSELMQDFKELRGKSDSKNYHKEEVMTRVNVANRIICTSQINVDQAVSWA